MTFFTETPEQEAARINAASGVSDGITADQVARNRDLNTSLSGLLGRKPDGTPIEKLPLPESLTNFSSVKEGFAQLTTGLKTSSAINSIINGQPESFVPDLGKTSDAQGRNVRGYPNVLEKFASYTPLWTLACLTPSQFNDPASYRNSPADLKNIVFSSAGRYDSQRVKIAGGRAPEYFLSNFVMQTIVTASKKTGNSNAISFSFDIYEPYSMGLFLQSLQLAALNSNHPSYLQAPYVLKLDIQGYTDDGKLYQGIAPKYFTLSLTKVTFDVTESGSNYKVEAIPYNHKGYGSVINKTYNDLAIVGEQGKPLTVKHLLVEGEESLCKVLNRAEQDLVLDEKILIPDEYEVQFPESPEQLFNYNSGISVQSATVNPNAPTPRKAGSPKSTANDFGTNIISEADMGIEPGDGGNFAFKKEEDAYDEATGKVIRDKMTIDPKNRKFQFQQGESITGIISKIVVASSFATKALQEKPSKEGFVTWFKLDVQIQLKEFDDKRGEFAKKIIFRVYPYKIHQSVFSNPTSAKPGYAELEKLIAKQYSYIYTGQNNDIIKFDIKIDNQFFTGANPKSEKDSATNVNVDQKSGEEKRGKETKTNTGPAEGAALASNTGSSTLKKDLTLMYVSPSPYGNDTTEQLVAKNFQDALLKNTTDLVNINVEILGDPYWLVDSGIANYFSPASGPNPLTTADGTMNYEGSDVYVYLTFRSPIDVNEDKGIYNFSDNGKESPFSGIYKVTMVENTFSDGVFKQKLDCLRMPLQAGDFDNTRQPVDTQSSAAVTIEKEEQPRTDVTDDDATDMGVNF